jgi:glycerophosphoryl diester phosphodiesterase
MMRQADDKQEIAEKQRKIFCCLCLLLFNSWFHRPAASDMKNTMLSIMARRWRELIRFALLFRVLESLLFAPVAALAGKALLGRTVLDSTALVSFLLSPRGALAITFAAVTALGIRLIEHAGLSAIFFGALDGRRVSAREALRLVRGQLLMLVRVSARFVGVGLLTVLPLLAVAGGFAARLLPRHDVNYYLKLHPPEFIAAAGVIGVVALSTAAVLLSLVVRWRWVVQALLFQKKGVRAAFAESAHLTRGLRWKLTWVLVAVVLASLALGLAASLLGDACAWFVLGVSGHGAASLAISFGALLLLRTIIGAGCTFLGSCLDAGVFTALYRRRLAGLGIPASLPGAAGAGAGQTASPRWLPAILVAGLLAFAAGGAGLTLDAISDERTVSVHAHRGVTINAPENTLAAAREAITAGADYLETDVQLSRDDVLVIVHDSDFSRLGGVARKVWDLTYDEIRAIPLGGGPDFTPTFEELLAETKGRIQLNIELKYYGDHQPGLAGKVVAALRRHGMLDQALIQCLEYEPLLEVRQLAPEVPIGYLLSFNARKPSRLDVDFLSVEQNRLDRAFLLDAHRRGQQVYAWTVNRPQDMQRLFDLGIDGLITDQSALARKTLDEYLSRPKSERAVRRVRSWLAD